MRFPEWSLWLKTRTVPTRSNLAPRVCPADCTAMVGKGISKTILRPDCEPRDAASRCAEWVANLAPKWAAGCGRSGAQLACPNWAQAAARRAKQAIRWVAPRVLRGN